MYSEKQVDGTVVWRPSLNLWKTQYAEEELIENYIRLNNWDILHTQHLSADFCVRWILDVEEQGMRIPYEETCIDDNDVLRHQPHLTAEDIRAARARLHAELDAKSDKKVE